MSIEEKLIEVAENVPKVYNAGYEQGKADNDTLSVFWDSYQGNGTKTDYRCAFSGYLWNNTTFKPKYSLSNIKFTCAINMFQYSSITTINYDLDFSNCMGSYANFAFSNSSVKKVKSITLPKIDNTSVFGNATKLTSIRINGTTEYNTSFNQSPLDKDSVISVINSLSTTTTGKSCAFDKPTVNSTFTTEEWQALIATKPNWTITLG